MEHFKKYNNIGRDLNGLSVENPYLYRWWYNDVKNDETPMYGNKFKKYAVKVTIEDIATIITLCLRHRLRKDPLESIDSGDKVSKVFKEVFEIEED